MEEKNEWVYFKEINWNCPKNNRFNIDTRDFHCGYFFSDEGFPDIKKIIKYDRFFYKKEEIISLLERLFNESGGDKKWRCLNLISNDERVKNWNLKYIRIFRTEKGFIVCNSNKVAIPKEILMRCKVDLELLN